VNHETQKEEANEMHNGSENGRQAVGDAMSEAGHEDAARAVAK